MRFLKVKNIFTNTLYHFDYFLVIKASEMISYLIINFNWDIWKITWKYSVRIFSSQEFHCCFPNCLRLVPEQSRAVTLPKLHVMIKDHILLTDALRSTQRIPENICASYLVTYVNHKHEELAFIVLYRNQWVVSLLSRHFLFRSNTESAKSRCFLAVAISFLPLKSS